MRESSCRQQADMPRWSHAAGLLVQAEMEKAILQGLTAAFRTMAERLPQLLDECRLPSPSANAPQPLRVLRIPLEETTVSGSNETTRINEATNSGEKAGKIPAARPRSIGRPDASEQTKSSSPRALSSPALPATRKESASPPAKLYRPPAPPAKKINQPDSTLLPLHCPACGAGARISWKRLDRLFRCRKCGLVFHVNREGHLTKNDSNPAKSRCSRLVKRGMIPAAALALLLLLTVCCYPHFRHKPVLAALPNDLPARSELWAKAWCHGDRALLRRLTAPTHDRQLHPWLKRHPYPLQEIRNPQSAIRNPNAPALPNIQIRVRKIRPQQAVVVLRIAPAALPALRELRLDWVQRGETWYFVPSLKR